jgi:hypothetical protein
VIGYILGESTVTRGWTRDGQLRISREDTLDLVEYLGKERPKQKKTVKMAPALVRYTSGHYAVSNYFYESESEARTCAGFVCWLIDTHSVTVEVDE